MANRLSIDAYRRATTPVRSLMLGRYRAQNQVPISVLYYHRVADWQPTPWTISKSDFLQHLDWLQENFQMISLDETIHRLINGNHEPAVAITFDDGYADNMDFAIPELVRREIPLTYYVSTHQVVNQQAFEHDEPYPSRLYPNSVRDLKKLVAWGIDIGAHTCHHVDLARIADPHQLRAELKGCRRQLINLLGCEVNHFAFPFGQRRNISEQATRLAREAGFTSVSGAYGGYNFVGQDPFFIQRFHGDPELARIQNWLTLDPRFLNVHPNPEWLETVPESHGIPVDLQVSPINTGFPSTNFQIPS